jgi:hypothetical protein
VLHYPISTNGVSHLCRRGFFFLFLRFNFLTSERWNRKICDIVVLRIQPPTTQRTYQQNQCNHLIMYTHQSFFSFSLSFFFFSSSSFFFFSSSSSATHQLHIKANRYREIRRAMLIKIIASLTLESFATISRQQLYLSLP